MLRKEYPIKAVEEDVVYARRIYKYTRNKPRICKLIKRRLNKRFRKRIKLKLKNVD